MSSWQLLAVKVASSVSLCGPRYVPCVTALTQLLVLPLEGNHEAMVKWDLVWQKVFPKALKGFRRCLPFRATNRHLLWIWRKHFKSDRYSDYGDSSAWLTTAAEVVWPGCQQLLGTCSLLVKLCPGPLLPICLVLLPWLGRLSGGQVFLWVLQSLSQLQSVYIRHCKSHLLHTWWRGRYCSYSWRKSSQPNIYLIKIFKNCLLMCGKQCLCPRQIPLIQGNRGPYYLSCLGYSSRASVSSTWSQTCRKL